MKNFSVKTADFDSLSISGESPIVQSDLGTAPNQIPLNKDLGSLAYMNAPQIEDLNVDTLELREIAAEMSETAVDVFVYDTRKDSDGGAWRHRTSHTSWYNEELNTATRGGRREFPAVAVIVAESNKVTIYDGDDPDLPMWMKFAATGSNNWNNGVLPNHNGYTATSALNGTICVASTNNSYGLIKIQFISDDAYSHTPIASYGGQDTTPLSKRNVSGHTFLSGSGSLPSTSLIVNNYLNDVAMTVLPGAPIDDNTGLPIPTIAVATDGGVSVIRDDGSVVDITNNQAAGYQVSDHISFTKDNKIRHTMDNTSNRFYWTHNIPDSDYVIPHWDEESDNGITFYENALYGDFAYIGADAPITAIEAESLGNGSGLTLFDENKQEPKKSIVAYVNSKYNTGWMPGDIKLAALSDTKNETVGVDESTELVNNGDFDSGFDQVNDGWYNQPSSGSSTPWTISGGVASHTGDQSYLQQNNVFEIGKQYALTFTVTGTTILPGSTGLTQSNVTFHTGTHTYIGTAIKTYLSFYSNTTTTIDNVSVTETGELITNGTFDNGTTGWTTSSELDVNVVNGRAEIEWLSGTPNTFYQSIKTIPGKEYVLSLVFGNVSGADKLVTKIGIVANGTQINDTTDDFYTQENQVHVEKFVASTTETFIGFMFGENYGDIGWIDSVSVRLAEDDRSVNNNGLQIFGEIDKTPVAPGADLVAYSGFSADNYLMQPYSSDLDFGTGDFCIMGWFNISSVVATNTILCVGDPLLNNGLEVRVSSDGTFNVGYLGVGSFLSDYGLEQPIATNIWNHFVITHSNNLLHLHLNGVFVCSWPDSNIDWDTHWSDRILRIGARTNFLNPASNTKLSLIRISATAPTSEQIAKIYRDEKPLFQDGAQATLYGTNDAVTALAYDDSYDLLHVGTASGRSVFNGLKRVDNTDVAVTTAISAKKGFVIAQ